MNNYSHGKIYKISDNTSDKVYIGSTTQSLLQRLYHHKSNFKLNYNVSSKYILQNNDYDINLLECVPCENKTQLIKKEQEYISLYGDRCVNYRRAFTSPDEKKLRFKNYYEKNKVIYLSNKRERNKIYTECACGGRYNSAHRSRHFKTNKHINYFSNLNNKDETNN